MRLAKGNRDSSRSGRAGRERRFSLVVLVVAALLLFSWTSLAAGPTKAQCIAANEKGDSLRTSGSLRAARASFVVCASQACPKLVRDDCSKSIADVDAAIPTVTFTAKNGADDTSAVTIAMDGAPLAKEANGKPVNVDPGEHTFTFTLAGAPPQTQKLVLREGEKNRSVLIQFGEAPKAAADRASGRLVVTSEPGATIRVDGRSTTLGRFDGAVATGSHEVVVSASGKITATRIVDVKGNATESVDVTLESEKKSPLPWVIGGAAVVVTAGLVVGGIVLFGSKDKTTPPPQGSLGGVGLASFR